MNDKNLTIKELEEMLNVSTRTLFNWREERGLPFIKEGNRIMFIKKDVLKWLEEQRKKELYNQELLHRYSSVLFILSPILENYREITREYKELKYLKEAGAELDAENIDDMEWCRDRLKEQSNKFDIREIERIVIVGEKVLKVKPIMTDLIESELKFLEEKGYLE